MNPNYIDSTQQKNLRLAIMDHEKMPIDCKTVEVSKIYKDFLLKIKKFCATYNKNIIFVTTPRYIDRCKKDNIALKEIMNKLNLTYVDDTDYLSTKNKPIYWKDLAHMADLGAQKYAPRVMILIDSLSTKKMNKTILIHIVGRPPNKLYGRFVFSNIFQAIQNDSNIDFHVLQFTWSGENKRNLVARDAMYARIKYTAAPIVRKPIAGIGSLWTVFKAKKRIKEYIEAHNIDVVMPRSTFPAMMVNRLKLQNIKVIFDADGLPLEERVDFAGLSKNSLQYKWLKKEETQLLKTADQVLVRSKKAVDIHVKTIGEKYRSKFSIVVNGRDSEHFKPNQAHRIALRKELKLEPDAILWVYCGSLGPQYGWKEMISVFRGFNRQHPNSKFLILTGNVEYAEKNLSLDLKNSCLIRSVPFREVPNYLSAADIAFAIRKPTYSMRGVAPIKLGEYLLMGLPTIASKGIGDTEDLLEELEGIFLFDHKDLDNIKNAITFAKNFNYSSNQIRKSGIKYFSLERSTDSYLKALNS